MQMRIKAKRVFIDDYQMHPSFEREKVCNVIMYVVLKPRNYPNLREVFSAQLLRELTSRGRSWGSLRALVHMVPRAWASSYVQLTTGVRTEWASSGHSVRSNPEFLQKQRQEAPIKSSCMWLNRIVHPPAAWQRVFHTFDPKPLMTPVCAVLILDTLLLPLTLLFFNFKVKDLILDFILVYCSVISLIVRNFSNLFLGRMPALQKAVQVDVCLEVTRKRGKKKNQCKFWVVVIHWKII